MKKIYTLLLSAAVAVSASAAAPVAQKAAFKALNVTPELATVANAPVAKAPAAKAPAKAIANIDEVYGSYQVKGEGVFQGDDPEYTYIMKISAGDEANEVFLENILDGCNLLGEVDLAAGTISVPYTNLGKNQQGLDIVWATVTINSEGYLNYNENPVVFKVTETGLDLQTDQKLMGLVALQNGEFAGCYTKGNTLINCTFTKYNPDEQWEDAGVTVQYTDALFLPFFDEAPIVLDVPLQKSKDDPNAFALVDPYKDLISQLGASNITYDNAETHRMVFHIDGTDIVWFEDFNSGIIWSAQVQDGSTQTHEMVFSTQVSSMCERYGAALVQSVYPDGFGHFENGTITYPDTMEGETQAGETKDFDNWVIEWGDYGWGAETKGQFKITGVPTPAGVKDIAVDTNDESAPVEYFNLQGARVSEPAAGLYIRRQGKTVTKIVIK